MNETQKIRLELEKQIWNAEMILHDIKRVCEHTNIAKGRLMWSPRQQKVVQTWEQNSELKHSKDVHVNCQDCDKEFGWWCPVNPKGYCEYKNHEDCIHCHIPSERK